MSKCAIGQCGGEVAYHLLRPDNSIYLSYCGKHWEKFGKGKENEQCIGVSASEYATYYAQEGKPSAGTVDGPGPTLPVPAEDNNRQATPSERRLSSAVAQRRPDNHQESGPRQLAVVSKPDLPALSPYPMDLDSRELAPLRWDLAGSVRFTREQEAILRQPANPDMVEIKPDGTVFMPGAYFRKVLNDAFGPGGWYLALEGQPQKQDNLHYLPAVLVVEGRPVARTVGEYVVNQVWEKPGQGTIWESCCTDAITKCCKTLGVAEELWFPAWCRAWKAKYAKVVGKNQKGRDIWARKDAYAGADIHKPGYSHESEYDKPRDYVDDAADHLDAIQEEA